MDTPHEDLTARISWQSISTQRYTTKNLYCIANLQICVTAVGKTKWWPRSEWRQLVDGKPNRYAHMHRTVISRLRFTSIYSHHTGRLGRYSGGCLLVIFPLSVLLLGTLGRISAPNGFCLLPGSLFLSLSFCGLPIHPPPHPTPLAFSHHVFCVEK